MRFLIIHNEYSVRGGEEAVVEFQKNLLELHGHHVTVYRRSYAEMGSWLLGKAGGMFTSVFNPRSLRDLKKLCDHNVFDVAIVHNVFPVISPVVIPFLKGRGIRVLQVLHNYRLFCPVGTFYRDGHICEDCTGRGREWNCFRKRCTGGAVSALSFAIKFRLVRLLNYYGGVDRFLCLNARQADLTGRYLKASDKVRILPNAVKVSESERRQASQRKYVSFVGRLSEEKGFFDFLKIAVMMPDCEFRVGGECNANLNVEIPSNVVFCGFLKGEELRELYAGSRAVLVLSKWYEPFGLVAVEAMNEGTPVIAYDLSGMGDMVQDGRCGFVVGLCDLEAVREKIRMLFENEALFEVLSDNACKRVREGYSEQVYYERLIELTR